MSNFIVRSATDLFNSMKLNSGAETIADHKFFRDQADLLPKTGHGDRNFRFGTFRTCRCARTKADVQRHESMS
jgi:hypothetical protein